MSLPLDSALVLLVDDEPNVAQALTRKLHREPFEFLIAHSGDAALELLEKHPVDVVVSDEQMPGMSGSQLLSTVRIHYPSTIRMILSGQATLEAAVRAINEGSVHRFFVKPCDTNDLAFSIKQALIHQRTEDRNKALLEHYKRQANFAAAPRPVAERNRSGETGVHRIPTLPLREANGDTLELVADDPAIPPRG